MQTNSHHNALRHQHVSVTYGDGEHSFWLKRSTTFAELAAFISDLDQLHLGAPVSINVTLKASSTERVH